MFIDIGATSREEALAKVSIGDVAAMKREFSDLDNRVTCKAMDDRIGCAVIIEAMKRASLRSMRFTGCSPSRRSWA